MSKGSKIFLWFFGLIQALFVLWLILAGVSAGNEMEGMKGAEREGAEAGTAIGIAMVIGVWACVDIIVGGAFIVWKFAQRVMSK
jgi:hypothetical protein